MGCCLEIRADLRKFLLENVYILFFEPPRRPAEHPSLKLRRGDPRQEGVKPAAQVDVTAEGVCL